MNATRKQHLIWAKNCLKRVFQMNDWRYMRMVWHHLRAAIGR